MKTTACAWGPTPVLLDIPKQPTALILMAHGAGAPMDSGFMAQTAQALCGHDLGVVRFEFPYMAKRRADGRKFPPNRMPVLLETWHVMVAEALKQFELPLLVAGKSMGGRVASLYLSQGDVPPQLCGGLVFGYPFHPPGKPDKLRIEHLPELCKPLFINQGTRDPFGKPDDVTAYDLGARVTLNWLESGEHDFKPLKKTGRTQQQLIEQAVAASAQFIARCLVA